MYGFCVAGHDQEDSTCSQEEHGWQIMFPLVAFAQEHNVQHLCKEDGKNTVGGYQGHISEGQACQLDAGSSD